MYLSVDREKAGKYYGKLALYPQSCYTTNGYNTAYKIFTIYDRFAFF